MEAIIQLLKAGADVNAADSVSDIEEMVLLCLCTIMLWVAALVWLELPPRCQRVRACESHHSAAQDRCRCERCRQCERH